MLSRVVRVIPLPQYRLQVEFDDGVAGTIDLADELAGPVFALLQDGALFRQVTIDDYGAVGWPNGSTLPCPTFGCTTSARRRRFAP